MDQTFQAILDSLPPKPSRSKLEPFAELIHELRRRGRSYRDITGILRDRCGIEVGVHTVYNFVRVRSTAVGKKAMKQAKNPAADKAVPTTKKVPVRGNRDPSEIWQRIQALKDRSVPARMQTAEKVFHYDENLPLTVTRAKIED
jgi:IS30 family transposase